MLYKYILTRSRNSGGDSISLFFNGYISHVDKVDDNGADRGLSLYSINSDINNMSNVYNNKFQNKQKPSLRFIITNDISNNNDDSDSVNNKILTAVVTNNISHSSVSSSGSANNDKLDNNNNRELKSAGGGGGNNNNIKFSVQDCISMKSTYDVVPGYSWGSLPIDYQRKWSSSECDKHVPSSTAPVSPTTIASNKFLSDANKNIASDSSKTNSDKINGAVITTTLDEELEEDRSIADVSGELFMSVSYIVILFVQRTL